MTTSGLSFLFKECYFDIRNFNLSGTEKNPNKHLSHLIINWVLDRYFLKWRQEHF